MTGLDDTGSAIGRSSAGWLSRPLRPYADIFRIPGAWRFSAAGVIGRMPMAMFGLGTVLLISAATGKYGMAGAVAAVGSLGYAFSAPRIARLVDSRGQRRVLLPLVAVFVTATTALIVAVELRLPTWAFFVAGAIAGAAMPSLGTLVRARWSALLAGSPGLHTAFSFESVADELCYVVGAFRTAKRDEQERVVGRHVSIQPGRPDCYARRDGRTGRARGLEFAPRKSVEPSDIVMIMGPTER